MAGITYRIRPGKGFGPKSYVGMFIQLLLYFGVSMSFIFTFLFTYEDLSKYWKVYMDYGLYVGLLAGLIFAVPAAYMYRFITIVIEAPPTEDFINKLNVALAEIGYTPVSDQVNMVIYKPSLSNGLFAGKITVQRDDAKTIVVGSYSSIKRLVKRLGLVQS